MRRLGLILGLLLLPLAATAQDDRLCFVQFIHPGGEHEPDLPAGRSWNTGTHQRKFLRQRGRFLATLDARPVAADLVFWRYDGVRWLAQAPSSRDADSLTKNDVTAFSDWALAADGDSTAVDVSAFAAQRTGDETLLTWSTASEAALAVFQTKGDGR